MRKTMLLLFLCLFSNYDLFNCNQDGQPANNASLTVLIHQSIRDIDTILRKFQQEIQKEKLALRTAGVEEETFKEDLGLLDYSLTPYWWHGTSGNDTAGQNTPDATFLPTPEGFGTNFPIEANKNNLWTRLSSLPGILYETSTPNKLVLGPEYFPDLFLQHVTLSPGTRFTAYNYEGTLETLTTIHFEASPRDPPSPQKRSRPTITSGPIMPSSVIEDTTVPSVMETVPSVTETVPSVMEETTFPFASVQPPQLPALRGLTDKPITFSKIFMTLRAANVKVGKAWTGGRSVQKRIKGNRLTPKPRTLVRTLSKAQAWVHDRRWRTTPTPGSNTSARREGTVRLLRNKATSKLWTRSSQTGYTGNLLHENDFGFLYVSVPEVLYTTTPSRSTLAGDVLFSAKWFTTPTKEITSPNKPFHDIMNTTDEGYVVVFLSELARLIVLKDEEDMTEVISHTELILTKLLEENKLTFAGLQITKAAKFISKMATDAKFDASIFKRKAMSLHLILTERNTSLSPEVNALIDYADMLFDDKKGENLFNTLKEFEDYPNTTKSGWHICHDILTNFIEPFRYLSTTVRGKVLLDNFNKALLERFGPSRVGFRKWRGDPMMLRGEATPKLDLSKLRKRYPLSLKRRMSLKRIRELNRTRKKAIDNERRQYYQTPWIPILRSMLPITRHQKRFRVITPRQMWTNVNLNNERPTQAYRKKLSGLTHPPNDNLEFFPQVPVQKKRAKPVKQSINHRRRRTGRAQAMLIRRSSKTQEQK